MERVTHMNTFKVVSSVKRGHFTRPVEDQDDKINQYSNRHVTGKGALLRVPRGRGVGELGVEMTKIYCSYVGNGQRIS